MLPSQAGAQDRETLAQLVASINAAVLKADAGTLQTVLDGIFHRDMVIRGPEMTLLAEGKAACIASYVEFAQASTIHACEFGQPEIDLFDDMAVIKSPWKMAYSMQGREQNETGQDVFMFIREDEKWLAAWRALLQP